LSGCARVAEPRDLGDDGGDLWVVGGEGDHVPAAEGGAPQRDPFRVDAVQAAGKADRGAPVIELAIDVDDLAWLPVAGTPAAVVKHQHRHAGGGEGLGVDE
jgi:hypothetical protein